MAWFMDNLDTDISCLNGKLYTHSFTMILMQHQKLTEASASDTMNQLTHTKSKLPKKMMRQMSYTGVKKPLMLAMSGYILPEQWSTSQNIK